MLYNKYPTAGRILWSHIQEQIEGIIYNALTHLWFGWLSSVSPAAPPGPSLLSSSTGSSSRGTVEAQLPSQQTLLQQEETACLLFPEHFREQRMGKKMGEGDSCNGRPSEAGAEEEEGRSAQNVTPLLLSRMIHGGWRGEFCSTAELLGRNGGFQVWRDAAEADEGAMLMEMLRRRQPPEAPMGPRDARNAGGEGRWSSREPHSHIHASASAHMMVQTCVELADRGGRGREGQDCGCHTAANNPRVTSSVEIRHGSHDIQ